MELSPIDFSVAGFLHDIGKFLERAKISLPSNWESEETKSLYQPFNRNGNYFTHAHARYSAYFFDLYRDFIPTRYHFTSGDDCIPKLSARHHIPSTPLEWIVAEADRISSGFDRDSFDTYNASQDRSDYLTTRLIPLFESAGKFDHSSSNHNFNSIDKYKYRYRVGEYNPENSFPVELSNYKPDAAEYNTLFQSFNNSMRSLPIEILQNERLWCECLVSLVEKYTCFIPSATTDNTIPDISLFDHLKSTGALAGAMFAYHKDTNTLNDLDSIQNRNIQKFYLVEGKFFGIQSFIFQEGGSTNRKAAKILRARSAMVTLLLELLSVKILQELNLTSLSRLLYAAGKFTLLLPNTKQTLDILEKIKENLNKNLYEQYFGKVSVGLVALPISSNDLMPSNIDATMWKLKNQMEEAKYKRWNPSLHFGVFHKYLSQFQANDSNPTGLCSYCGERPEDSNCIIKEDNSYACKVCKEQIELGTNLFKKEILVIYEDSQPNHIHWIDGIAWNFVSKDQLKQIPQNSILRQFDLKHKGNEAFRDGLTPSPVTGYIPIVRDIVSLNGNQFFERRGLNQEDVGYEDMPLSFWGIAALSTLDEKDSNNHSLVGVQSIAGLKADVDRLGQLLKTSFRASNLSRFATFSRMLDYFFTDYLKNYIHSRKEFKGTYTIFSGGDDLFLILPSRYAYQFIEGLREKFSLFTCNNDSMSFSAGISFHKPGHSIRTISKSSERELEHAKSIRNAYSLFEEICPWQKASELWQTYQKWEDWLDKKYASTAFYYRINSFIESHHYEEQMKNGSIDNYQPYLSHLLWRSHFKYSLVRTFATNLSDKDTKDQAVKEALDISDWIDKYGNLLKHTLWYFIYNNRKEKKL